MNATMSDQITMVVLSYYLVKSDIPIYATVHAYTGNITFYKVPELNGHV